MLPKTPNAPGYQPGTVEYQITQMLAEGLTATTDIPIPTTPDELYDITVEITGIHIPRHSICIGHSAPFDAYCAAYFAQQEVVVWKASRGLGGKSILLAALSMVEAVTLGAAVNLLGGSGEQSQRVLGYMVGDDTNVPNKFWAYPSAPRHLLDSETKQRTKLTNHGRINTLTASQKSVRGPHPQRLRLDECDEMELPIFDAAMGQPMPARGIVDQVVCSSTHQYPDGTMTEILERAQKKQWPVFEWCYRESQSNGDGWLTSEAIARTRSRVTQQMWQIEYELQEPSADGRAIDTEAIEMMFDKSLGVFEAPNAKLLIFEKYDPLGDYVNAADWAKKHHWSHFVTWRVDCTPFRLVAFRKVGRIKWPNIVEMFEEQALMYPGENLHDATGIGDVVDDLITQIHVRPIIMIGRPRQDMFTQYVKTVENHEIVCPHVKPLYKDHIYVTVEDIYGTAGHPPDGFVAMSLANLEMKSGWAIST